MNMTTEQFDKTIDGDRPTLRILGLDGKPLPKVYSVNIYAIGAPFLSRKYIGIPKVQKQFWYTFDEDGLTGISRTKGNGWKKSGINYESEDGRIFLIKGKNLDQEFLTFNFNTSLNWQNEDAFQEPFDVYDRTPLRDGQSICKKCFKQCWVHDKVDGICAKCRGRN